MSPTRARRRPTSADVARAAGVSRSTVSYVLNETPGARVSDATRQRVLAAVKAVGYVANVAASDLRRGASRTVLLVIDEGRAAWAVTSFAAALSEALRGSGLTLFSAQVAQPVDVEDARLWAGMRPVAVLNLGAEFSDEARAALRDCGALLIGEHDADVALSLGQGALAALGARTMLERGRQRIVQVLPSEPALAELTRPRVAAFRRASGRHGLGTLRMPLSAAAAAAMVDTMLAMSPRPDAIVAHNDDYAAALLGALGDAGIAVPGQIALLGADDNAWIEWLRPRLSTIAFDTSALVRQFADLLLSIAAGSPAPAEIKPNVPAHVIHRQTT